MLREVCLLVEAQGRVGGWQACTRDGAVYLVARRIKRPQVLTS
jgi:hypothetical protein